MKHLGPHQFPLRLLNLLAVAVKSSSTNTLHCRESSPSPAYIHCSFQTLLLLWASCTTLLSVRKTSFLFPATQHFRTCITCIRLISFTLINQYILCFSCVTPLLFVIPHQLLCVFMLPRLAAWMWRRPMILSSPPWGCTPSGRRCCWT